MRIAILDDYQDCVRSLDCFAQLDGHDVLVLNESIADPAALAARIADREALVLIRERTRVGAELLDRLPALRLISQTGRAGGHIDEAECTARGVAIAAGTGSPLAPAELTWALVLAASRGLVAEAQALRAGRWQSRLGRTVRGRTLGILGYGNIGRLVAGYGTAFGMRVLAHGGAGSRERAGADGIAFESERGAFFAACDVLSVHLRLAPSTRGMIDAADLAAMRPDALFVNTSRAELVAPGALLAALDAGRPAMAALDVFEREPADESDPLIAHPRVLATPHIGYVERDSYELYFGTAFQHLLAFAGGKPTGIVNPAALAVRSGR
ncbi:MAG: D-2-hydroxyacid dehydrogenase family protein [Burkholderiales bacterium]|nr:MAG: D-2-hydroxyacid dehydrogenase family protein [Burkholderiales bacterium]